MAYENSTDRAQSSSAYPRKRRKKKKPRIFRKAFLVYLVILVVCSAAAIIHVRSSLIMYEKSQPNLYIDKFVSALSSDSELVSKIENQYFSSASLSKFDDVEACKQQFNSKMSGSVFTYKVSGQSYDTSAPVYDIYADDSIFMTVTLKSINPRTRLGIMTISDWEIQSLALRSGDIDSSASLPGLSGTFEYTISAPSMYSVYVNDIELGNDELTGETKEINEFKYASEYVEMPKLVTYHIEGLIFEPKIVIKDGSGEDVEFTVKNGRIEAKPVFTSNASASETVANIDALEIAKTWSKLMTDDLSGANHGLGQVQKFLISGSYLSQMATDYAGSVDITFVSAHVINSFTGEKVENYIKYTDNCFSCDVYFEKNMYLTKTGENRTDIFNNRMFFVHIEDSSVASPGWYLVDMQTIID